MSRWARLTMRSRNWAAETSPTSAPAQRRSQAALGPMGPIVNAATYVAGPGKILGPLAAIGKGAKTAVKAGRAALEGVGAGAISSEGHDLGSDKSFDQRAWDAAKQGAESAAFGVGGNWLGQRNRVGVSSSVRRCARRSWARGRSGFGNWRAASAARRRYQPGRSSNSENASGHIRWTTFSRRPNRNRPNKRCCASGVERCCPSGAWSFCADDLVFPKRLANWAREWLNKSLVECAIT